MGCGYPPSHAPIVGGLAGIISFRICERGRQNITCLHIEVHYSLLPHFAFTSSVQRGGKAVVTCALQNIVAYCQNPCSWLESPDPGNGWKTPERKGKIPAYSVVPFNPEPKY